jgi:hypothetical protein
MTFADKFYNTSQYQKEERERNEYNSDDEYDLYRHYVIFKNYEANNGRAVAEDGFVWIHKDATYSALALLLRQDDSDVIKRFSARLTKLLDNAVTPFFCLRRKEYIGKTGYCRQSYI